MSPALQLLAFLLEVGGQDELTLRMICSGCVGLFATDGGLGALAVRPKKTGQCRCLSGRLKMFPPWCV